MEESSEQKEQLSTLMALNPTPAKIFSSFGEFYGFFEALVEESQDDNKKLELQIFPKRPSENATYVEVKTVHGSNVIDPSQQHTHTTCQIYKVLNNTKAKLSVTQTKEAVKSTVLVNKASDSTVERSHNGQESEVSSGLNIQADLVLIPDKNGVPSTEKTSNSVLSVETVVPVGIDVNFVSTVTDCNHVSTVTDCNSVPDNPAADSEVLRDKSGHTGTLKTLVKSGDMSLHESFDTTVSNNTVVGSSANNNSLDDYDQNKYSKQDDESPVITYHYILDEDFDVQSKTLDSACSDQGLTPLTNAELEDKFEFQKLDVGLGQNVGSHEIDLQKTDTFNFNTNSSQERGDNQNTEENQNTKSNHSLVKKRRGRPKNKKKQTVHYKHTDKYRSSHKKPMGRPKGSVNKKISFGTHYLGTVDVPGSGRRSQRVQYKCQELIQKRVEEEKALRLRKESKLKERSVTFPNIRSETVQTDYFLDESSDIDTEKLSCSEPTTALCQIMITDARSIGEQQFSAGSTEGESEDSQTVLQQAGERHLYASNYIPVREMHATKQRQPVPSYVKKPKMVINRRLLPNMKRRKIDKKELKNVEAVEKEIVKQQDQQELSNEVPVVIENIFGDVIYVVGDEDVYDTPQNIHTRTPEMDGVTKVGQQQELLNTFDASVNTFPTGIVKNAYAPIGNDNIQDNVQEAFSFATSSPQHLVNPITNENPIPNFDAIIGNSMENDFFHSLGLAPSQTVKPKRKYRKRKRIENGTDLNEPLKKLKYSAMKKSSVHVVNTWTTGSEEAPVKAKLGRPRKYNKQNKMVITNNVLKRKKKRIKLIKRGPGRPKKVIDIDMVKVKKKLGRPKKEIAPEEKADQFQDGQLLNYGNDLKHSKNMKKSAKYQKKMVETSLKIDKRRLKGKINRVVSKAKIIATKKHSITMTGKRNLGRPKKIKVSAELNEVKNVDFPDFTTSKNSDVSQKERDSFIYQKKKDSDLSKKEKESLTKSSEDLLKTGQVAKKRGRPKKISSQNNQNYTNSNSPMQNVETPHEKPEQVSLIEKGKFIDFWESKRAKRQYHKFPFKMRGKHNIITLMNLEIPLERIQTKDIKQEAKPMKKKRGRPKGVYKTKTLSDKNVEKTKSVEKTKKSLSSSEEQTNSQVNDSRNTTEMFGKRDKTEIIEKHNGIREVKSSTEISKTQHKDKNEGKIVSSSQQQQNVSQILAISSVSDVLDRPTINIVEGQNQVETASETVQTQNANKFGKGQKEWEFRKVQNTTTIDTTCKLSEIMKNKNAIIETRNATEINTNVSTMATNKTGNRTESCALHSPEHNNTAVKKNLQRQGETVIIDSEKGLNFNVIPIKAKREVEKAGLDISISLVSKELIVKPMKERRPLTINYKGQNTSPKKRVNKTQYSENLQTLDTLLLGNKNAYTNKNIEGASTDNQATIYTSSSSLASGSVSTNEKKNLILDSLSSFKKDSSVIQPCGKNEASVIVRLEKEGRNEFLPVQGRKQISLLQNQDILSKAKSFKETSHASKNTNQNVQQKNAGKLSLQSVLKKGVNVPPKKKMGRPRKQVFDNVKNDTGLIDIDAISNDNNLSDNCIKKKKRGRPPNSSCGHNVNKSEIKVISTDQLNLASPAKKKKIGRPKKIKTDIFENCNTVQSKFDKSETSLDSGKTVNVLGDMNNMKHDVLVTDTEQALAEIKRTSDSTFRDIEIGLTFTNVGQSENCMKQKNTETLRKRWQEMDKKCFKLVRTDLLDEKAGDNSGTEMKNETANSDLNLSNSSNTLNKCQETQTDVYESTLNVDSKLTDSKYERLSVSKVIRENQETNTFETENSSETHQSQLGNINMYNNKITYQGITFKQIVSGKVGHTIFNNSTDNEEINRKESSDMALVNNAREMNQMENEKKNLTTVKCPDNEMEPLEIAVHEKCVKKRGRPPKMPVLTLENVENMFDKIKKGRDNKAKSHDSKSTAKNSKRKPKVEKYGHNFKFSKQHPAVKKAINYSLSETGMKKKLGRPRKVQNQMLDSVVSENCTDMDQGTVINQQLVKLNKIGRPKKIHMKVENCDEIQIPKKFGRPKKNKVGNINKLAKVLVRKYSCGGPKQTNNENNLNSTSDIDTVTKKVDGRGRKKKKMASQVEQFEENKQIIADTSKENQTVDITENNKPSAETVEIIGNKTQIELLNLEESKKLGEQILESGYNASHRNDIMQTDLEIKKKCKLGRPKKYIENKSFDGVKIRKGRGRPKKISENTENSGGESITVMKKSVLGRPKKIVAKHNLKGTNPSNIRSKKNGPGRPKKIQEDDNYKKSSEFQQNVEKTVKRGRPKKNLQKGFKDGIGMKSFNLYVNSTIENIFINTKSTDGSEQEETTEVQNSLSMFDNGRGHKLKSIPDKFRKSGDESESNVNIEYKTKKQTGSGRPMQKAVGAISQKSSYVSNSCTVQKDQTAEKPNLLASKKKSSPEKLKKVSYDDILNKIKVHVTEKSNKPTRGRPKTKNVGAEEREMPKLAPECPLTNKTLCDSTTVTDFKIKESVGEMDCKLEEPVTTGAKQDKLHSIGNIEQISGIKKTTGNVYVDSETFLKLKQMAGTKNVMSRMSTNKPSLKILKSTGQSYVSAESSTPFEDKEEKSNENVAASYGQKCNVNVKRDIAVSGSVINSECIGNSMEGNHIAISKEISPSKESLNDELSRLECNYEVVFDIESQTGAGQFSEISSSLSNCSKS